MFGLFDNRLFDSFFSDPFFNQPQRIKDQEGVLHITVDMPGVDEKDVDIQLKDRRISISGNRKTKTSSYMIRQEAYLSDSYDLETVKASLKNGVLTISIMPKQLPPAKVDEVKKIPISTET